MEIQNEDISGLFVSEVLFSRGGRRPSNERARGVATLNHAFRFRFSVQARAGAAAVVMPTHGASGQSEACWPCTDACRAMLEREIAAALEREAGYDMPAKTGVKP